MPSSCPQNARPPHTEQIANPILSPISAVAECSRWQRLDDCEEALRTANLSIGCWALRTVDEIICLPPYFSRGERPGLVGGGWKEGAGFAMCNKSWLPDRHKARVMVSDLRALQSQVCFYCKLPATSAYLLYFVYVVHASCVSNSPLDNCIDMNRHVMVVFFKCWGLIR